MSDTLNIDNQYSKNFLLKQQFKIELFARNLIQISDPHPRVFTLANFLFCYIDFLGYLLTGEENNRENFKKFLSKFDDNRYSEHYFILFKMWRCGLVHEIQPKIIKINDKDYLTWTLVDINHPDNRKENLKIYRLETTEITNILRMVINLHQFYDDILHTIDKLIDDDEILDTITKNLEQILQSKSLKQCDTSLPQTLTVSGRMIDYDKSNQGCVTDRTKSEINIIYS